jgi:hypothetical protein
MNQQEVDTIIQELLATQYIRTSKSHPWVVVDGPYDFEDHQTRMFIYNGFSYIVAAKMWVEDKEGCKRLPEWMQVPWGSYPNLPPKPPKK